MHLLLVVRRNLERSDLSLPHGRHVLLRPFTLTGLRQFLLRKRIAIKVMLVPNQ